MMSFYGTTEIPAPYHNFGSKYTDMDGTETFLQTTNLQILAELADRKIIC